MLDINGILKFKEDLIEKGDIIVVEGINDKKQLSLFGIDNIFEISGNSLGTVLEKLKFHNINSVTIHKIVINSKTCSKFITLKTSNQSQN